MKKSIYLIASVIIFFTGCASDKNINKNIPEKIDAAIEQNGSAISIINDTAELRRTKFSIIFNFAQPDSVLINASFSPDSYNMARDGVPLKDIPGFKDTSIAEELFNRDSMLYISLKSSSFWYYTDDTDNRFNSVIKSESGLTCRRDIASLDNIDINTDKIDLVKMKQDVIYVIIVKFDWNEDYTQMIERGRKYFKIKFII